MKKSLFYDIFNGEYVSITTKAKMTESLEAEEGRVEAILPVIIEGFLLDEDGLYYYLGKNSDGVTQAVKKSNVIHVEIVAIKDMYDELLDNLPVPKNRGGIN